MKLRFSRFLILKAVLAMSGCVLVASIVIGRESGGDVVQATTRGAGTSDIRVAAAREKKTSVPDLDLSLLNRTTTAEVEDRLFLVPTPPSPPEPPPQPPAQIVKPKPTAPPLPFKYLGRMIDGSTTVVFVGFGESNLSLRQGDVVDNLYRVEQVAENQLTFVYIPLNERQNLITGERN